MEHQVSRVLSVPTALCAYNPLVPTALLCLQLSVPTALCAYSSLCLQPSVPTALCAYSPLCLQLSVPTALYFTQISNCNKALIKLNSYFCSEVLSKRLEFNSTPVHVEFVSVAETWVMFFSENLRFPLPLPLLRCSMAVHSLTTDVI